MIVIAVFGRQDAIEKLPREIKQILHLSCNCCMYSSALFASSLYSSGLNFFLNTDGITLLKRDLVWGWKSSCLKCFSQILFVSWNSDNYNPLLINTYKNHYTYEIEFGSVYIESCSLLNGLKPLVQVQSRKGIKLQMRLMHAVAVTIWNKATRVHRWKVDFSTIWA